MRKDDVDLVLLADLVGRIFPPCGHCPIERTEDGASTQVYRLRDGGKVFYLRVAEEREASLAPEGYVHETLRLQGVKVPEIVFFTPFDEGLERSIVVTTEIPGVPLTHGLSNGSMRDVLRDAGRDLAIVNSLPVDGFGWIERDKGTTLKALHESFRDFALEDIAIDLALLEPILTGALTTAIWRLIERADAWSRGEQAWLAHGDLDASHIFQHHGQYSGLIDFGEIRGTTQLYDLAHANLQDAALLPFLLEGWSAVLPLPEDFEHGLIMLSLLIGIHALANNVRRYAPNAYRRHLVTRIQKLVAS